MVWRGGACGRCHPETLTAMNEHALAEQPAGVDRLPDELLNRADADQAELLAPDGWLTELRQPNMCSTGR